jgi:hypothetical protein
MHITRELITQSLGGSIYLDEERQTRPVRRAVAFPPTSSSCGGAHSLEIESHWD